VLVGGAPLGRVEEGLARRSKKQVFLACGRLIGSAARVSNLMSIFNWFQLLPRDWCSLKVVRRAQ
jgi:hypothetical protein